MLSRLLRLKSRKIKEKSLFTMEDTDPGVAETRVLVHLRGVAGAPRLTRPRCYMDPSTPVAEVEDMLRKVLEVQDSQPIFLFCMESFAPTPDTTLDFLRSHIGVSKIAEHSSGELVLSYGFKEVWG